MIVSPEHENEATHQPTLLALSQKTLQVTAEYEPSFKASRT